MSGIAERVGAEGRFRWGGWLLGGASLLLLLGSGGLLWWRHGAAVFSEYVVAALAWCF